MCAAARSIKWFQYHRFKYISSNFTARLTHYGAFLRSSGIDAINSTRARSRRTSAPVTHCLEDEKRPRRQQRPQRTGLRPAEAASQ